MITHAASTGPTAQKALSERKVPDWDGLWDDCPEVDLEVTELEGKLPQGLVGRLYRNGPGKRSLGTYFFDGDGMIRRLTFTADGRLFYRSRFVRTKKFIAEIGAREPRVRTAGTQLPGGAFANFLRMPANEANTHVIPYRDRLLALYEGGPPHALDLHTLDTIGIEHFEHQLSHKVPFSAHPHFDPETGELYNFGVNPQGRLPKLCAFKLNAAGKFEQITKVTLPYYTFLHDFALSERFMAFPLPNVSANLFKMMSGREAVFDTLKGMPGKPSQWIVVSRDGKDVRRYEIGDIFPGHIVAAREEGDELVIDGCTARNWDEMTSELTHFRTAGFNYVRGQRVMRYRFDTKGTRAKVEELCGLPADFPRFNESLAMHRARYAYFAANPARDMPGLFRGVLKLDLSTGETKIYDPGPGAATNEPIFVPDPARSGEDAGFILAIIHDGKRKKSNVVVLDAQHIEDGPVCTARLPVLAGMTFHGTFLPGV